LNISTFAKLNYTKRIMTKDYNDLGVEFKYLIVNDMDRKFGLWV